MQFGTNTSEKVVFDLSTNVFVTFFKRCLNDLIKRRCQRFCISSSHSKFLLSVSSWQRSLRHDSPPEVDPVFEVLAHLHPGLGVNHQVLVTIRCHGTPGTQAAARGGGVTCKSTKNVKLLTFFFFCDLCKQSQPRPQ